MPLSFITKCLFSPFTILSVLGLNRLIFAPCYALKRTPPFPAINLLWGDGCKLHIEARKVIGCPKQAGGPAALHYQKEGDTDPAAGYKVFVG